MANSPTIVSASLSDEEMRKSVKNLVDYVNSSMNGLAKSFDDNIEKMNASLKKLGTPTSGGSANTSATKQDTQATDDNTTAKKKNIQAEKEKTLTLDQQNTAQKQAIQTTSKYSEQVRKLAQEIRASKEWQEKGHVVVGDINYYDKERANVSKRDKQLLLSLEEQIVQVQQKEAQEALIAADAARQQAQAQQQVKQEALGTARILESVNQMQSRSAAGLKDNGKVNTFTIELESAKALSAKLKELKTQYDNMSAGQRLSKDGQAVAQQIREISRQAQKLNIELNRPTRKEIAGLSEKTLDDIAYKMRQLQAYRSGLDVSKQTKEISQVNDEYNRLKKRMDEVMQKNQQMIASNTALGHSWNYMKNRLAFYFTVGASTSFVKNLIEIRSQYEMNERALGILIDSAERGTQIFNELSQMALVSPYTLIELSTAAKQLTAYDIAAKDVVDTTRRLADMAAAVGIPIERLTYALGQIKAYGYLNARDARMFSNAGIPLVKQLSEYYTELEGRLVSTADIYDRIKKKTIGFEEVVNVISKMTDEGGKFYDFQAKMAETLKVKLANLTLAWNNMLNAMGEETQGVLVGGINTLKQMFLHWKDIEHILTEVVVALGAYKAYQIITTRLMGSTASALNAQILAQKRNTAAMLEKQSLVRKLTFDEAKLIATQNQLTAVDYKNALSGKNLTRQKAMLLVALNMNNAQLKAAIVNMGLLTTQEVANMTVGKALSVVFKSIGISIKGTAVAMGAFMVSNWWLLALGGIYELYHAWDSYDEHVKEINRSAAEHAKETFDNIKKYLESDVVSQLQNKLATNPQDVSNTDAQKAWDEMREKIELSSKASNVFIAKLMQIDNVNDRLKAGFEYLKDIERVAGAMQNIEEDAIKVSTTTFGGLLGEGLKDDLQDFMKSKDEVINAYGDIGKAAQELKKQQESADVGMGNILYDMQEFSKEVKKTTDSIYNVASKEGFNMSQQREFFEREISEIAQAEQLSAKETRIFRMKAEEEYFNRSMEYLKQRLKVQKDAGKAAMAAETEARIKELQNQFGAQKSLQESFFSWVSEKHSSEVRKRFGHMTKEEIAHIDWSQKEWAQWAKQLSSDFSKEYGVSFDELYKLVLQANTWKINIPVFFQTIGQPLSDLERDYESRTGKRFKDNPLVKDAKSQVEIIDILKKKQKEVANEQETARNAGGKYWEDNKERLENENKSLTDQIHAYNALTDAEEKANKKKGGSKKDILGDALSKEVQLITDIRKRYEEYKKMGVDTQTALTKATDEYGVSLKSIKNTLSKFGITGLKGSDVAGMEMRDLVKEFEKMKQAATLQGNVKGVEALEKAIAALNVEITKVDYKRITDGLNNELGKLKDEYELAVELDANPELGDIFLDMFGIDKSALSSSIDDYMFAVQDEFRKKSQELGYSGWGIDVFKANEDTWRDWGKNAGLSDEALDNFKAKFVDAQNTVKKVVKDTITKTKELEYNLADTQGKIAIETTKLKKLQADREIADAKSKDMSLTAEQRAFFEQQKQYIDLQIQGQEQTIARLGDEVLQMLPTYKNLFNSIVEHSDVATRKIAKQWKEALDNAVKNANGTYTITDPNDPTKTTTITAKQYGTEVGKVDKELRKGMSSFKKIKEAFSKGEDGTVDWAKGIGLLGEEIGKLGNLVGTIGDFAEQLGFSRETVEIINDVANSINGVATMAQGLGQFASGDYIGGAARMLSGLMTTVGTWLDNSDNKILDQIKESERAVKKLENAMLDLEDAANHAYGAIASGAQRGVIANKELQLAELKRQIQLEKSRDSKHRDEDRIVELEGQYKQLLLEIKNGIEDVVNEMLGISSAGDAVTQLVESMVEAFRNGEDAMQAFSDKWDEMIDNMILKIIVSQYMQKAWENVLEVLRKKEEEFLANSSSDKALAQSNIDAFNAMSDREKAEFLGIAYWSMPGERSWDASKLKKLSEEYIAHWMEVLNKANQAGEDASEDYLKWSLDYMMGEGRDYMQDVAKNLIDGLGDWYTFGQDKDSALSALQQGIQGITEDTAGAIEAYLNGISQQIYLHSTLLTEIRDAIVGISGGDLQLGVQSQMLLQLQDSYTVQKSIESILAGVLNPSGRAFAVELIS